MDVTSGIALRKVTTVIVACQCGFNGLHFFWCDSMAWQATFGEELRYLASMVKTFFVAVNMQDALFLEIEINAFCLSPCKQMFARSHC